MSPDVSDIEAYRQQVEAAVASVREEIGEEPAIGLVLGTGLKQLADEIDLRTAIAYEDIPHFPTATVASHEGRLLFGTLDDVPVVAQQGRVHLYEGYTPRQVTFSIRLLALLGVETLLMSNAAGGMNPHLGLSDLMLVTDHINLQGSNPLVGPNVEEWGPRFPDMSEPYDPELRRVVGQKALEHGIKLHQGVYIAVEGPSLETKAEYRMLRQMGADVVGMSTVPEVIVARHMDVRVLALSVITDECFPDALEPISVEEVMAAAGEATPKLSRLMRAVVQELGASVPAA